MSIGPKFVELTADGSIFWVASGLWSVPSGAISGMSYIIVFVFFTMGGTNPNSD